MELPSEVPVMTLPRVNLFPKAMMPLYIFEPRYRHMLADVLATHRMFSVAMQKPGRSQERPHAVAGLGLVRVSVARKDGTSDLFLEGITRVELAETIQYRPYRVQRIYPLKSTGAQGNQIGGLMEKILDLVNKFLGNEKNAALHGLKELWQSSEVHLEGLGPDISFKDALRLMTKLTDASQVADMICCTLLPDPLERQTILETLDVQSRLRYVIRFLIAEIRRQSAESEE